MVYCGEELGTSRYVVDVFLARKFQLIFGEFLNWTAKGSKLLSLSDQTIGRGVGGIALENED